MTLFPAVSHHWMHHRTRDRGLYLPRVGPYAELDEIAIDTLSDVSLTSALYNADTHTRANPYMAKTITLTQSVSPTNKHVFIWCDTIQFNYSLSLIGQGFQANGGTGGSVTGIQSVGKAGGPGGSGGGAGATPCTSGCPLNYEDGGNGGSNGNDGSARIGTAFITGGVGWGKDIAYDDWAGYLIGGDGGGGGYSSHMGSTSNGGAGGNAGRKGAGGGGGGALSSKPSGGNQTGGAGGGGSGGKVIIVARYIVNLDPSKPAYFTAKGGNGGATSTFKTDFLSGAGGGGGGGTVQVWAQAFASSGINTQVTGGLAGNDFYGGAAPGDNGQAKIYSFDDCFTVVEESFSNSWDYRC